MIEQKNQKKTFFIKDSIYIRHRNLSDEASTAIKFLDTMHIDISQQRLHCLANKT